MHLDSFKEEIKSYIKNIYELILEDYNEYLPQEKKDFIKNFNYDEDIVIDDGGKYSNSPGRWERKSKKIHFSPKSFYESSYKEAISKDIEIIDLKKIEKKLNNSANEEFKEEELLNFIKQKNLSCLDVIKGIVIHEVFHSIISIKDNEGIICVNYNNKVYECKGVKGEYLEEGLVEYFSRKFANKYNLFMIPSIPYQDNVEYAKKIESLLGKNIYKMLFNNNYKNMINYIHEVGLIDEYNNIENKWLVDRIINRLKIVEIKENMVNFEEL